MIIKRFSHIKFDNFFSLLLCLDENQMFQSAVIHNIFLLLFTISILLPDQSHKITVGNLLVFLVYFNRTIKITPIKSCLSLIFTTEFQKTWKFSLFYTVFQTIVKPINLNGIINLFLSLFYDSFNIGINSFDFFGPIFVL